MQRHYPHIIIRIFMFLLIFDSIYNSKSKNKHVSKSKKNTKDQQNNNLNLYQEKTDFEKMLSQLDFNESNFQQTQNDQNVQSNNQSQGVDQSNQQQTSINNQIKDQTVQNTQQKTIEDNQTSNKSIISEEQLFKKFKKQLQRANRKIKKIKQSQKNDKDKIKDLELSLNLLKTQYQELKFQNDQLKNQLDQEIPNVNQSSSNKDVNSQIQQTQNQNTKKNDQEKKENNTDDQNKEKIIDEEASNLAEYLLQQTNSIENDEEKNKILLKAKQLVEDPQQEVNDLRNIFEEKKQKQIKQIELDLLQKAEAETDIKKKQKILNSVKQLEKDPQQVIKAIQEKVLEDQFIDNIPENCKLSVKNALKIKNFDRLAFLSQVPKKTKIKSTVENIINDNHMNEFLSKFFVDWLTEEVQQSIRKKEKSQKKTKKNKSKSQFNANQSNNSKEIQNDQFKKIETNNENLDGKNSLSNLVEIISKKLNFNQFQQLNIYNIKFMLQQTTLGQIIKFLSRNSFLFQTQQQNGSKTIIKVIVRKIDSMYLRQFKRLKKGQTLMLSHVKNKETNLIYVNSFKDDITIYNYFEITENFILNKKIILQTIYVGNILKDSIQNTLLYIFIDKNKNLYYSFQKFIQIDQGDIIEIHNHVQQYCENNIYLIYFNQEQIILRNNKDLSQQKYEKLFYIGSSLTRQVIKLYSKNFKRIFIKEKYNITINDKFLNQQNFQQLFQDFQIIYYYQIQQKQNDIFILQNLLLDFELDILNLCQQNKMQNFSFQFIQKDQNNCQFIFKTQNGCNLFQILRESYIIPQYIFIDEIYQTDKMLINNINYRFNIFMKQLCYNKKLLCQRESINKIQVLLFINQLDNSFIVSNN